MNQLLLGLVVVIVFIGGGYFLFGGGTPSMDDAILENDGGEMSSEGGSASGGMEKDDAMTGGKMEDGTMMEDGGTEVPTSQSGQVKGKGSYETYSPEKLSRAQEGEVVLFFRASWCPTCKALDANIRANLSNIPEGVTILSVDYDTETALKKKYGVTYQHTLVQVSADGTLIKKWSGSPTLTALLGEIS